MEIVPVKYTIHNGLAKHCNKTNDVLNSNGPTIADIRRTLNIYRGSIAMYTYFQRDAYEIVFSV